MLSLANESQRAMPRGLIAIVLALVAGVGVSIQLEPQDGDDDTQPPCHRLRFHSILDCGVPLATELVISHDRHGAFRVFPLLPSLVINAACGVALRDPVFYRGYMKEGTLTSSDPAQHQIALELVSGSHSELLWRLCISLKLRTPLYGHKRPPLLTPLPRRRHSEPSLSALHTRERLCVEVTVEEALDGRDETNHGKPRQHGQEGMKGVDQLLGVTQRLRQVKGWVMRQLFTISYHKL
jgi:hypothetical protein